MRNIKNEAGVLNARYGRWRGAKYLFTHRDPKSGNIWGENIPIRTGGGTLFGKWVPADEVTFC